MKQSPDHFSWRALSAMTTAGAECIRCGSPDDLVAHHKVPRKMGGLDVPENLVPVCRSCHPAVEQEAVAEAKLTWERPEFERPRRPGRRRRPRLIPPY